MTTESASNPVKATAIPKKRGRAKYLVLLGLVLTVLLAWQTGVLGFGLAALRSATFPRDESLLEYVPGTANAVVIVDPHQVVLKELGAEGGTVRAYVDRTREDIAKATGISLAFDVDKLIVSPALLVVRGRFNERKVSDHLTEHSYTPAEYKGVRYQVRAGEDALAVIDGSILLYGSEAEIRAGIDAREAGTSMASREEITARLSGVGWAHPILGVVQLAESKPSLRAILTGSTGPRAVAAAVSMKGGLSALVAIDAATPDAAEEMRKLLEEKRADAEALKTIAGPEVGAALAGIAGRAKLTVAQGSSQLTVVADVRKEELDALAKASEQAASSFGAMYKNVRLLQLLTPGL